MKHQILPQCSIILNYLKSYITSASQYLMNLMAGWWLGGFLVDLVEPYTSISRRLTNLLEKIGFGISVAISLIGSEVNGIPERCRGLNYCLLELCSWNITYNHLQLVSQQIAELGSVVCWLLSACLGLFSIIKLDTKTKMMNS